MHTLDYTYRLNGAYKQDKLKKWYDSGDLEEKPGSGSEGRFLPESETYIQEIDQ